LNESIPHTIASFFTHVLATAWTGFQIYHTNTFRDDFNRLTTHGTCGQNLLIQYWPARAQAEYPSLVLNGVALLVSAFLSWKIIKVYPFSAALSSAVAKRFCVVVWLADIQTCRRLDHHRAGLQNRPLSVD
jgi:hypothetical protein